MGFSQEEIEERLPEIEAFAELGDFIRHPVKTYSSGMYVRLAFSAAIHVDPEILIVDEALAVGDAKFQSKCFRKFEQFRKDGKTVILVTHDPNAVVRYCDTAMLLDHGRLLEIDHPRLIINHYMELLNSGTSPQPAQTVANSQTAPVMQHVGKSEADTIEASTPLGQFLSERATQDRCPQRKTYNHNEHRYGERKAEIIDYFILCRDQVDPAMINSHDEMTVYIKVYFHQAVEFPIYGFTLKSLGGVEIYGNNSWFEKTTVHPQPAGATVIFQVSVKIALTAGDYFINLGIAEKPEIGDPVALDRRYDLIHLQVVQYNKSFGLVDLSANFCEFKLLPP